MTTPSRAQTIEASGGTPVEVPDDECRTTDEAYARDFTGRVKLSDEIAQPGDDVVAVQCVGHQTLARVSRHTRTPRSRNSPGTSAGAGIGSAGSTSRVRGVRRCLFGASTHAGVGSPASLRRRSTSAARAASQAWSPVGSGAEGASPAPTELRSATAAGTADRTPASACYRCRFRTPEGGSAL